MNGDDLFTCAVFLLGTLAVCVLGVWYALRELKRALELSDFLCAAGLLVASGLGGLYVLGFILFLTL